MQDEELTGWLAHPRSRGENTQAFDAAPEAEGSSPLTRGKHDHAARRDQEDRLIPAHAGKTVWVTPRRPSATAHPRSRGENRFSPPLWPDVSGSSPLTRGKHAGVRRRPGSRGLIPAHAGKTPRRCPGGPRTRAHPRSRGENGGHGASMRRTRGSSPLTRGKPRRRARCRSGGRLIPAHAGKTARWRSRNGVWTAHPRSRGENDTSRSRWRSLRGSSPLTRGKPVDGGEEHMRR